MRRPGRISDWIGSAREGALEHLRSSRWRSAHELGGDHGPTSSDSPLVVHAGHRLSDLTPRRARTSAWKTELFAAQKKALGRIK